MLKWNAHKALQQVKKLMPHIKNLFKLLDADDSGIVTLEEVQNAPESVQNELTKVINADDLEEIFRVHSWLLWNIQAELRKKSFSCAHLTTAISRLRANGSQMVAEAMLLGAKATQDGWATTPSLFPRLVLGWINADFRVQMRILQHFSRSSRRSSSLKQILRNM